MIKVAFVRGAYLNNFEAQNYIFNKKKVRITGISALRSIHHKLPWEVVRLPSLTDLNQNRVLKPIFNRLFGDGQILLGLKKYAPQFDIFHTADPHYYYSYQLAKLRAKGKIKKLISTSWETIPYNNETVGRKKRIKEFTRKNVDIFICHTEKAKKCLIKEGVPLKKIRLVRLGVNTKKFLQKHLKPSNTVNLLFVGRLVEEKGVMDLYNAFKNINSLRGKVKDIRLKIVGNGPLKSKLMTKIRRDKVKDKASIEEKKYEQMVEAYEWAEIFILPSKKSKTWEEQYGMVLIEAMASGLPIVAYDTGVIREIVGAGNRIVPEGKIRTLTNSLLTLIDSKSLRARIGTMNRKRAVLQFDSLKISKEIEAIYYEAIRNNS